jgi:hypothetical protein
MKRTLNHRLATCIDTLYRLNSALTGGCDVTTVFRERQISVLLTEKRTWVVNMESGCSDFTHELLSKQGCNCTRYFEQRIKCCTREREKLVHWVDDRRYVFHNLWAWNHLSSGMWHRGMVDTYRRFRITWRHHYQPFLRTYSRRTKVKYKCHSSMKPLLFTTYAMFHSCFFRVQAIECLT